MKNRLRRGVGADDERVSVPAAGRRACATSRACSRSTTTRCGGRARTSRCRSRRRRATAATCSSSGDLTLSVHSDPASFADMRWVYPRLPADGRGKLDLEARSGSGAVQDYHVHKHRHHDRRARTPPGRSASRSATRSRSTTPNLRFSGVDTRTARAAHSASQSPRRGVLAGHATVSGGRTCAGAEQRRDVRRPARRTEPRDRGGRGRFSRRRRHARARSSRADAAGAGRDGADVDPTLPIGGMVTGSATVNGSTTTQLAVVGERRSRRSRHAVGASTERRTIRLAGGDSGSTSTSTARPVSLVEVGRFFPAAGLQGSAAGPDASRPARCAICACDADLRLPDGGRFATRGTLDLASKEKGVRSRGVALHAQSAHDRREGADHVADGAVDGARAAGLQLGDDAHDDRRRSVDVALGHASPSTRCRCARASADGLASVQTTVRARRAHARRTCTGRSAWCGAERASSRTTSPSIRSARSIGGIRAQRAGRQRRRVAPRAAACVARALSRRRARIRRASRERRRWSG